MPTQSMPNKYLNAMDKNGDHAFTREEFENSPVAEIVKSFDILQPDPNGSITHISFVDQFVRVHRRKRSPV